MKVLVILQVNCLQLSTKKVSRQRADVAVGNIEYRQVLSERRNRLKVLIILQVNCLQSSMKKVIRQRADVAVGNIECRRIVVLS